MRTLILIAMLACATTAHAGERIRVEDRHGSLQRTIEKPSRHSDRYIVRDRRGRITHDVRRVSPDRMIIRDRRTGRIVGNIWEY